MNGVSRIAFLLVGVGMTATLEGAETSPRAPWLTLPAGTVVIVRLTPDVDLRVAQAGTAFRARVENSVSVDGSVVIPRGAEAVVQAVNAVPSGASDGGDRISLSLTTISIRGRDYALVTNPAVAIAAGGQPHTSGTVSGVACTSGTAGADAAAVVCAPPAETRLQFTLAAALRIQV